MVAEVNLHALLLVVLLTAPLSRTEEVAAGSGGMVVTIVSQGDAYHSARAGEKREQWLEQLSSSAQHEGDNNILLSHELPVRGKAWTMVPLFPYLAEHYSEASWFFFTNEETQVDFETLWTVLGRFDKTKVWFLGHALKDQRVTIIHHYLDYTSSESISYPNFASGWLLSGPALKRAAENAVRFSPNFNIDPQFELAVFLKYLRTPSLTELFPSIPPVGEGGGYLITHLPELCMEPELTGHCATAYSHSIPDCGEVELNKLFVGVKTCKKYHSTRLPVLQGTWAGDAGGSIAYYSEVEDEAFHTIDIGVPNTESGHCGKMMAIIGRFWSSEELREREWLVIADDDTLLSVPRLRRLLACYSPDQPILLGEVYGFNAYSDMGYSYVTGGGSMVLSREAVKVITESNTHCPRDDAPDDMYLGNIAQDLGIIVIHSPLFHQAQPETFHPAILSLQTPISFHRHRPEDPHTVYRDYLTEEEGDSHESTSEQVPNHTGPSPGKTEL